MMYPRRFVVVSPLLLALGALGGCAGEVVDDSPGDAVDSGGGVDATADTGSHKDGGTDSSASVDSSVPPDDAGNPGPDSSLPVDASQPDTSVPIDSSVPDTSVPDTGPIDAGSVCALALGAIHYEFDNGAEGWTHAIMDGVSLAGYPIDEWQVGTATSGPGACHSANGCWATRLDKNYTACERAALTSPGLNLAPCAGQTANLVFWHAYDFWTGSYGGKTWFDGGIVEISADAGQTWTVPTATYPGTVAINQSMTNTTCLSPTQFHVDGKPGYTGTSLTWSKVTIAIPAAYMTTQFMVRFAYGSGVSHDSTDPEVDRPFAKAGWYIDDVTFSQ